MVTTPSTMLPLQTEAPDFSLQDAVTGATVSLADLKGSALVVMFICNHCPFVIHIRDEIGRLVNDYQKRRVAFVAINSNSLQTHPQDGPDKMKELAQDVRWSFPFLFDSTQEVAKAYRAACTPDFYLFDAKRRLVYRGQLDDSRPNNGIPLTGKDLRAAIDAVLAGKAVASEQMPSLGCNIKWTPGNEPDYFG
ncbi:MAG: thioredoxin family protein [Candidatus Krumholzibacteria bacterium]|nr:thioredoxin family protein [Candidatus Krumholzibacteria bacterium]